MRRPTMQQPSGPATSATPMPPTRARVKKSSSIAGLPVRVVMVVVMVGHYATVIQVSVVVVVAVERPRGCRLAAEEGAVLRALGHRLWRVGDADVDVQDDHGAGAREPSVEGKNGARR